MFSTTIHWNEENKFPTENILVLRDIKEATNIVAYKVFPADYIYYIF